MKTSWGDGQTSKKAKQEVTSYFRLEQYWFMHISYEQIICTKSDEVVYCGNQPGVLSIQLKM